jgi:hypothetical protein
MPDTGAATSTVTNQLPPRTTTSHRWPRKWATLGGRGSTLPRSNLDEKDKTNGHHANGNGHRYSTSLFRKSSTISRTNGTTINNENPSLKKSRSLINVLRSKLNSPAVLRRFRTKSRESSKQIVTEIIEHEDKKPVRKRDPSPMKRLTSRLAQLTRSSTHTSIENEQQQQTRSSPSPPIHNQDQVDHINACYDEIRAKYFDKNNNSTTTKPTTIGLLAQHPCAPLPTDRLKDMLSTTASSIDYYDRPNLNNGDIHNRSLSTISMNGSLLSHDFLNNSQQYVPSSSPPKTSDDPLLQARKQSNIKLNCMLSGYGFTTPFGNHEKNLGQHDLFKFHHYHDVGKRKFDFNFTSSNNRMYSSLRTRPMSRSIDSFRRATTTVENELIPTDPSVEPNENSSNIPSDNELVIREDGDILESERKTYSSKVHVTPAVSLNVKTFVLSTAPNEHIEITNGKLSEEHDEEFERSFLRAVDRALGVHNKDLQPVYDTPLKIDDSEMNLVEMTERALSSFKNTNFFTDEVEHRINGTESPNVELFDRTGELFDTENVNWQSSAVYDHQTSSTENRSIDVNVYSVVDDLTRKTQDLVFDEPQVSSINN